MSSIRVLVADDYGDWRRQVRLLLEKRLDLKIVCEVADGPDAVARAEELKPDLILLDVGLPTLSGIDAAHQIGRVSPNSKILLLTLNNSPDLVQAALSVGALGCVYKLYAMRELLQAVDAVLRGEQFFSASLTAYEFPEGPAARPRRHDAEFYVDEKALVEGFARFIAASIQDCNAAVLIASKPRIAGVMNRLRAHQVQLDLAIYRGSFIPLDAHETLSTFMIDNTPDEFRFFEITGRLIEEAAKAARGDQPCVALCGECASLLWAQGKPEAAIRLEQLWDRLMKIYDVDVLCGYELNTVHKLKGKQVFRRICAEHSTFR